MKKKKHIQEAIQLFSSFWYIFTENFQPFKSGKPLPHHPNLYLSPHRFSIRFKFGLVTPKLIIVIYITFNIKNHVVKIEILHLT